MAKVISAKLCKELMSKSPARGVYAGCTTEFLAGNAPGIAVMDEFPGKKPESVKQGFYFTIRKAELQDKVHVATDGSEVYLIRK